MEEGSICVWVLRLGAIINMLMAIFVFLRYHLHKWRLWQFWGLSYGQNLDRQPGGGQSFV